MALFLNGLTWGKAAMDFFELWLGISPDGGSGTLEALYFIVPIAVIVVFALLRYTRPKSKV
jgi:hypothetical protein